MKTILGTLAKTITLIAGAAVLAGIAAHTTATITAAAIRPALAGAAATTVAVTPAATRTPTPVAVPTGTVVSADQVKHLADGIGAYEMADGTFIAVAHKDPVPANVIADIQTRANARWPNGPITDYNNQPAQEKALEMWMANVSRSTGGRTVLVVVESTKLSPLGPGVTRTVIWPWMVLQNTFRNWSHYRSLAEAQAGAASTATSVSSSVIITLGH